MISNPRTLLSLNIKYFRQTKGLTQASLAELASISTSHITEIENENRFPSSDTLQAIAEALEVKPFQLFMTKEERTDFMDFVLKKDLGDEIVKKIMIELAKTK